jgi:Ethanolamine utilization protein EutJ (predicted chaperonin)
VVTSDFTIKDYFLSGVRCYHLTLNQIFLDKMLSQVVTPDCTIKDYFTAFFIAISIRTEDE